MDLSDKHERLGMYTKALLELHIENTAKYNANHILNTLLNECEKLRFEEDE